MSLSKSTKKQLLKDINDCDRLATVYLKNLLPHLLHDPTVLRRIWLDNPEIIPSCKSLLEKRADLDQKLNNVEQPRQ
jgi:hypothetical protein